jgi:hypothetical protein
MKPRSIERRRLYHGDFSTSPEIFHQDFFSLGLYRRAKKQYPNLAFFQLGPAIFKAIEIEG